MISVRRFTGLILLLILSQSPSPFAAIDAPLRDQLGQPQYTDRLNENTPHEAFPLFQIPESEPIRSEVTTIHSERAWRDLRTKILSDFNGRMSADFAVPDGLTQRTEFWFDVYTRYGEAHHIVHHVRYPWIVFRVVNTTETLLNGKGPAWLRREAAQKLAHQQAQEIRRALRKLATRKDYSRLPQLERGLFDKLLAVQGSRKKVLREAAANVRTQLGQKDFFEGGLVNSSRYLPYMEEEFKKLGLPYELTRMPFVESSFNEKAHSKAGASGIWQIMPQTGKAYMIVDHIIDERNSPLKATVAAGRLLRSYYKALNSWPLTITSYNHGIGNIQKAIHRAKSKDLSEIVERYHQGDFRFASANFFTCFLAALYAERYHELIFNALPRQPLQEREVIKLGARTRVRDLTKVSGIEKSELLRYNLDLRNAFKLNSVLPRGFQLHVPPGTSERFSRQIGTQENKKKTRT